MKTYCSDSCVGKKAIIINNRLMRDVVEHWHCIRRRFYAYKKESHNTCAITCISLENVEKDLGKSKAKEITEPLRQRHHGLS
jgi:hypothetical protein